MDTAGLPAGFEPLPVYAQEAELHTHPTLAANGIRAFTHSATGVRLVHFAAPGPLVSATIIVGTRPISNAGHPHTLEHIIFLGSQNHPRGYLDNLACRCLADGTNAWTDNEYTAYTTTTAGFDGFAHILPAFLDHILRPRISEAGFASEVYHVRADGKEAGVVFCEMQARENTEGDLSDNALRAALLPDTPLQYDSGGLCGHIRNLTNEDVARFHYDQYCTSNISVVVGGTCSTDAVLASVKPLLDEIASPPGFHSGVPSWSSPLLLAPLSTVTRKVVPFPCPDEDIGTVILGWRGPGVAQRQTNTAIDVLLRYLAADVWSPLRQRFVETEDQLASDIYYSQELLLDVSTISLSFSGVQHLEGDDEDDEGVEARDASAVEAEEHVIDMDDCMEEEEEEDSFLLSGNFETMAMGSLREMAESGELPGGLDAIRAAIKKERETQLAELESGSHEVVPYRLIEELVYGHREDLIIGEETRGFLAKYEALAEKDEAYWVTLLRDVFVTAPRVEIVMVPDAKLAESLAEKENNAVTERIGRLGKDTLEKLGMENEERIESIKAGRFDASEFPPMPSTMNISRWPYTVVQETTPAYGAQSVTLETDFVHCTIFLDTTSLTTAQRLFLPVLCELIPSCDVLLADGSYIPYTDNSRAMSEATISTDHSGLFLGFNNDLAHQCAVIHFTASPESFEEAAHLTLQTLFQAEITAERLAAVSQTLVANATSDMRDGAAVLGAAVALLPYLEAADDWEGAIPNFVFANFLGTHPLVTFLSEEFTRKKPRKQVQRNVLRCMHESLDAMRVLFGSDVFIQVAARDPKPAHQKIASLWEDSRSAFMSRQARPAQLPKLKRENRIAITRRISGTLSDLIGGDTHGRIIGISGVESCCVEVRVDSPVYNGHADWSAITVLSEMLCRMEGPLSNAVRGAGLAYGISLHNSSWRGHLTATIYESASPAAAWDAVCEALIEFRKGLDSPKESGLDVDIETAKAATLFSLNRGRSTPESIAVGAISRTALGAPASPLADRSLEEAVEKVSLRFLAEAFDRHVVRLLEPRNRLVVVTCGQGVVQETIAGFEKCVRPIWLQERSVDSLYPRQMQEVIKKIKKA